MYIEYEGRNFAWHYDSLYGVGRFEHRASGMITSLETGSDCQQVRRELRRMFQKTHSPKYPAAAPQWDELLDNYASQYSFIDEDSSL